MYEVTHISASQLSTWHDCQGIWYHRYVLGLKIPPSYALPAGGACHRGWEANYRQKIESHEDIPADDAATIAVEAWEDAVENEEIDFEDEKPDEIKDRVAKLTETHIVERSPDLQPVEVETESSMMLPNEVELVGIKDIKTTDGVIRDLKTGKRKKSQKDLDNIDLQAAVYQTLDPASGGFVWEPTIGTSKGEYYTQTDLVPVRYSEEQLRRIVQGIILTTEQMKEVARTGDFIPAINTWRDKMSVCTPDNCGYWDRCMGRK